VRDSSWGRRGFSLLWSPRALWAVAQPREVASLRSFFEISKAWPEDLRSGAGRTLVVAGFEAMVDSLTPEDGTRWLEEDLKPLVLRFQDEYEGHAGLVFWVPSGRQRVRTLPAGGGYVWICATAYKGQTLSLGQILWTGAESDAGRILDLAEENQDIDGPAWIGLHHPRIS
jgi:hypothetical protein